MKKAVSVLIVASMLAMPSQLVWTEQAKASGFPVLMEDAYWSNSGKASVSDFNYVGTVDLPEYGTMKSAIRFNLDGVSGAIGKATLRIYIDEVQSNPLGANPGGDSPYLTLYGIDSESFWTGSGMPVPQSIPLADHDADLTPGWNEFDVTSFVQNQLSGDRQASFFLTGSEVPGFYISYHADDFPDPGNRPQLILEEAVAAAQPNVSPALTSEDTMNSNGLVIAPPEVGTASTHYKITDITGGTLYKNDGTVVIHNNDFITLAEGQAGLKYMPAANAHDGSGGRSRSRSGER